VVLWHISRGPCLSAYRGECLSSLLRLVWAVTTPNPRRNSQLDYSKPVQTGWNLPAAGHEWKGSSPGKTTGRPAEAHMIIMACTRLLEREPVEIAYRVVVSAAVHDELQGVQTLRKFDGRNLERLPGLPSFGFRN